MSAGLRLGHWQDVMADVERCDVLLTDPPYSARTHDGERGMRPQPNDKKYMTDKAGWTMRPGAAIDYDCITEADCDAFAGHWAPRVRSWALTFGDHHTWRMWEAAWSETGWYTFAPVVWVKRNAPPRFAGDGPQSSCEYILVARPKRRVDDSRSRPGHYLVDVPIRPQDGGSTGVIGTKDVEGLVRVVLDYTRPGDLVVDPFAGTATVAAACLRQGRRYIGSEMDPDTHAKGLDRIEATRQDPVVRDRWGQPRRQKDLFG